MAVCFVLWIEDDEADEGVAEKVKFVLTFGDVNEDVEKLAGGERNICWRIGG